MGVNQCCFVGRFVETPQILRSASGSTYTRFFLAVNEYVRDKSGKGCEKVSFLPFIAYDDLAREITAKGKKGMRVTVESSVVQSMYRAPGSKNTKKELIFRVKSIDFEDGRKNEWHNPSWF